MTDADRYERLADTIAADPGNRGVAALRQRGDLRAACTALIQAQRVAIVTGFFIPSAGACETDGPLGAGALAEALVSLGKSVVVLTDSACLPVVAAATEHATDDPQVATDAEVLVAIERLGRARDGRYYNMRGVDITAHTAPLDGLFLPPKRPLYTIGVGDGGNEIGMGVVHPGVVRSISLGERIASAITTDFLIVCGVSNWGGWALAAGLGVAPTAASEYARLERIVAAGAVDGVTGRNECTVDGLPWEVHADVLAKLSK